MSSVMIVGPWGNVEQQLGGVFAAYVFRHGYALLESGCSVPMQWFGYVLDTVYSQSMDLIGVMGKHPDLTCFSGSGGHPWLKTPKTEERLCTYKEERQMSVMVAAIKTESVTVASYAGNWNNTFLYRRAV